MKLPKLFVVDSNLAVTEALKELGSRDLGLVVRCQDIDQFLDDNKVDAVVAPTNSFAILDSGFGMLMAHRFPLAETTLQAYVRAKHGGELLVGTAQAVTTGKVSPRRLIAAPVVRTPGPLPADTVNPYLATRAALREATAFGDDSIVLPGMGSGAAKLDPLLVARQMLHAVKEYRDGRVIDEGTDGDRLHAIADHHHYLIGDNPGGPFYGR